MQNPDVDAVDRLECPREVLGENRCGEPELAVIGQCEGVVDIGGPAHRQHRPEQLLSPDVSRFRQLDDRRSHEVAVHEGTVAVTSAAGQYRCPLGFGRIDTADDVGLCRAADDGTHLSRIVARISYGQRIGSRAEDFQEPIGDSLGEHQSRSGRALLPTAAKRAQHHLLDSEIEVCVVEDYRGVFTAHLGLDRHAAGCGRRRDSPAHPGRAGKGDGIDSGMVDQRVTGD